MSLVLLDTHAWVWLVSGNSKLGKGARSAIEQSSVDEAVLLSAISPWEVAMLVSKGRLALDRDVGDWVQSAAHLPGIRLEPITPEIAVASTRLPWEMHADPADRLIAATARHLGATLITMDQEMLGFGAAGHIRVARADQ